MVRSALCAAIRTACRGARHGGLPDESGATPLELTLFNSVWTESPAGTWTAADSNESAASSDTQVLLGDGRLINKWASVEDSDGVWICFRTAPSATQFYQCQYAMISSGGVYYAYTEGVGAPNTGVSAVADDLICINRVGTTITFERSTDNGASWTVLNTSSIPSAVALYAVLAKENFLGTRKVTPTVVGFTAV